MMKLLFLIDSLKRGGTERRMLELVKGLIPNPDVDLAIITFNKNVEYTEIFDMDVTLHILERKPKKDPRVFGKVYRIAKEFGADILHCWGTMSAIYAIPTAQLLSVKFINGCVVDAPKDFEWTDSRYLRTRVSFPFSDLILSNSKAGLRSYKAPSYKSQCVYNGFDFNRIRSLNAEQKIRQRFQIQTPYVVGMVGAFMDRKDYKTYIGAALEVLQKRTDVTFMAIGDGPNWSAIKALVPREYEDKIILPGQIDDIESVVNIFNIGILCVYSLKYGEGVSNAIMEYMVLQKPVIATEGGGNNEIIMDGETGFLVPYADTVFLARKINLLLSDKKLAQQMGKAGNARIKNQFSLDRMKEDYLKIYENILS